MTEVAEIGVERFTTRYDQKDRPQHEQATSWILGKEPNGVRR